MEDNRKDNKHVLQNERGPDRQLRSENIQRFDCKWRMIVLIILTGFNADQKAKEVVESEQGMFKKIMTRCVDNLQVCIQNLHIRFESNNP